jgi:NitT/TauT family transport system substrate-binding protein
MARRWAVIAAVIGVAAVALFVGNGRRQRPADMGPRESLRFGLALQTPSALAILAVEKGFFADENLDVSVKEYPSGQRALEALLNGEVDVATTAETPVVFSSFERPDLRVIATIGSTDSEHRIVARRDRGISVAADLRGKRIGTQRASAVHFFLYLFLLKEELSEQDVTAVFLPVEELVPALAEGTIDAASLREPYASDAVKALGPNAVVLLERGLYVRTEAVATLARTDEQKVEVLRRLMRALMRAEEFARRHREEAMDIVASKIKMPLARMAVTWSYYDFRVALEQALFKRLEFEARWMINKELTPRREMPNYLRVVHPDVLDAVNPKAVTIIR